MNIEAIPFKIKQVNAFKIKNIKDTISEVKNQNFFTSHDLETKEGLPIYYELDECNRTTGGIAIISSYTLSPLINKKLVYPNPSNWNNLIDTQIFNKCHAIAYSLSAKKNDKLNIFIGTHDLNTKIMRKIEQNINNRIKYNPKEKILYRVRLVYKNKEIIPRGILIETKSLISDFEEIFYCPNIEKNIKFDYNNGHIISDKRNMLSKVISKRSYSNTMKHKEQIQENIDFVINRKDNIFHLANCKEIKNVNPKYLNETRTDIKSIQKKFIKCNKCIK